jgi:hypothetical protein
MPSILVFEEPLDPSESRFGGLADWYRSCASPEARAARRGLNVWYGAFQDRDGMLLGNLQSDSDIGIQIATDELYTHHLLSSSYEARYEEDAGSPDFRLYRSSEYVAGIEVFTLFPEKDFTSKVSRSSDLVKEINRRVRPFHWYVRIDVRDWKRQPRVTDVAKWLEETVAKLPAPPANLAREDYPAATYSDGKVELAFDFLPRRKLTPPTETEPIVAIGPAVIGWGQAPRRLRERLSHKVGSRYDVRDRPFAVLVSARDYSCDTEDIVNALYGDEAITFPADNPDSVQSIRKNNGAFGRSASAPEARIRRLSCVFVLMRGWVPGSTQVPKVLRFDNPFANQAFPDDVLTPDLRLVPISDELGVHMEWEPGPPSL